MQRAALHRVSHGFKDMHEFGHGLYQGWPSKASFMGAFKSSINILGMENSATGMATAHATAH